MEDWFLTSFSDLLMVVISAIIMFAGIILLTRIAGLRSFSKMSSFDFAMTIAVGSIIASTLTTKEPVILQGAVALSIIFVLQKVTNILRQYRWFQQVVDNEPVLLMKGGELLLDNMERSRVTLDDLRSKLREANVLELSQVRAVVFETTGDISVLHSADASVELELWLLEGVRDAPEPKSNPLIVEAR
ncbi:DUF421 domain-containing protein [Bradymonas sediminis]|uniref:DUF421 domain-containing protein n=1 Tax=Bradymonas sediminis TaxID=1548548 RepID=A0A2Z4FQW9_9DELT|nr:DUF421 domain-containing protein [Bradymonas sediminis]